MAATVYIQQDFNVPAEKVFNFFCDHNRLGEIWDGKFQRIKDSPDPNNVNGEGSVRLVQLPGIAFEESITKVVPNKQIEYTISKGSPLRSHYGTMKFINHADGTSSMDYRIDFDSKIPMTNGLLKMILKVALGKGVRKLAKALANNSNY